MLGSDDDADDAIQEARLRLSRAGGDGIEDLRAWLTTVTSRVCLDVESDLGRIRDRVTGHQSNQPEEQLRSDAVAVVEDTGPHYPVSVSAIASARAARPASYCRVDWPTAAQITSSKSWSSVKPASIAVAKSASVT